MAAIDNTLSVTEQLEIATRELAEVKAATAIVKAETERLELQIAKKQALIDRVSERIELIQAQIPVNIEVEEIEVEELEVEEIEVTTI